MSESGTNLRICCCDCNIPPIIWYPNTTKEKGKSVAIGILVALVAFTAITAISYAIQQKYPHFKPSQDAIKIFNLFKNKHPILNTVWRATWRIFVVLIGPFLEEVLFRGVLAGKIKKWQGEVDSTVKKVIRVVVVGIIFGAMHLSPFQSGMSNLLIFGVTSGLGIVFMVIKEWRKDLLTPITAHIAYNLMATL
ncbi:MAG: lysostaphin resistance A-like protein [Chlamydiales bacterium]